MSEHYFSEKPQSKRTPKTWSYQLRGETYTFTSDDGVFSKGKVDYGTQLLIESFEIPEITGDILDLGCGYGPVGIVLANCFEDRNVVMVDVNERAINLAAQNILHNNVENTTSIQSDRFSNLKDNLFAAVLTNPPIRAGKKVVYKMFEESELALKKGGELWVVIQKKQGAPSAKKKLETLFDRVDVVERQKGYFIFRAIKS